MDILNPNSTPSKAMGRRILSSPGQVWNLLTLITLFTVLCVGSYFFLLFTNPHSSLNPFPPALVQSAFLIPTATATPRGMLPPTWTPQPTATATLTPTARPSATMPPTFTPFPSNTPLAPTATVKSAMPFVLDGKIQYIANIAHPEQGCDWLGVTGQVKDQRGAAVRGQQVMLGGDQPGSGGDIKITLTGLAPQSGPGYYEFPLGDKPVASRGDLWIQLLDQAGVPLSEKIAFDTFNDCEKNMIVLNLKRVR